MAKARTGSIRLAAVAWSVLVAAAPATLGPFHDLSLAPDVLAEFMTLPEQSRLTYHGHATFHDFDGISQKVSGRIFGNPRRMQETARVEIRAEVAGFDSGIGSRDQNMREAVEADRYPEVVFVSDRIQVQSQAEVPNYRLPVLLGGKLTFHGQTRRVEVPVKLGFNPKDLTMSAEGSFPVKMSEFGVKVPSLLFITVQDRFEIEFNLKARLQSPRPEDVPR